MVVSVVGGHGQIALVLTGLLALDGISVRSLIRNPDHADAVSEAGGSPVVVDFEVAPDEEIDAAIAGSNVVVFAAGAGPGSGVERKESVDYGAAVRLIEAARRNGSPRYVMISAVRADPEYPGDDVFSVYLRAKGRADAKLLGSGLDHLILRPVGLTDDPAASRISLVREVDRLESDTVPRADVAAVLAEAIVHHPEASGIWNLSSGELPVTRAFA
ncbi:MAG: NAD(P)H-binding protein [Solirubrobacterales bacterium]|nr:NAD(P)H-binding protein [Solirubrobacterales bacterium]